MRLDTFAALLGAVALGTPGPARTASEIEPVPVYREPDHHLVFENELVRVLDIRVPPGHISKYHIHANPLVSVTVQDARSWSQKLGEPRGPITPRGDVPTVSDNWDQQLPYTHRVGNADAVGYHRVAAEWLRSPASACSPLAEVQGFRELKDGRFGRIYMVRLLPGQSTPPHIHSCPGLTVQGTDGKLKNVGTSPAGEGGKRAGRWYWRNAGYEHVIRNDGQKPLVVYEIDWR